MSAQWRTRRVQALTLLRQGACVLSGLAYNGLAPAAKGAASDEASRSRWDRCRNIDPVKIEFANNWKELLDAWNMNTST
jgi:lysophospholipid acyltransferase